MKKSELVQPRETVTAKNELFRLRAKDSNILASRIFMGFATLVTPEDVERGESKIVSIPASSVIHSAPHGGDQYNQIRAAAHFLVGKTLERTTPNGGFEVFTLFSFIRYEAGILTGKIDSALLPFFLAAKHQAGLFTKLDYQAYIKLSSIYSQKLFAFLSSWSNCRMKVVPIEELHDFLQSPRSQRANFSEFSRRALIPAEKDINTNTAMRYTWESVKTGRKVTAIRFVFQKGSPHKQTTTPITENTSMIDTVMRCWDENRGKCASDLQPENICKLCRQIHRHTSIQQNSPPAKERVGEAQ
nr:unnamed protein product [uncultured bacterium]